jgi:hypothetical protein
MTSDGHTALSAILTHDGLFPRVKDKDLIAAAIKLASKQVTAAGLTSDDLLALKAALGAEVFEKTLESLSPYHIKLLARRLDKDAPEIEVNTASSALSYVRQILSDGTPPATTETPTETPPATPAKKNKYLGRKAFRTGR